MTYLALLCGALLLALYAQQRVFNAERQDWAKERAGLIQRIQAPEIAARQFAERPTRKAPMPVPIDDDNAHREARERREALNGQPD